MYFDRRLWELTFGLRGRIALAAVLGILATFAGIARFVLLGTLLARVFAGATLAALALPIVSVAAGVLAGYFRRRSFRRSRRLAPGLAHSDPTVAAPLGTSPPMQF